MPHDHDVHPEPLSKHDHKKLVDEIRGFISLLIMPADWLAKKTPTLGDDIGVAAARIMVSNDEIANMIVEELNRIHPEVVQQALAKK